MAVVGEPSHPQVLFAGFAAHDPGYLAMAALVPSAQLLPEDGFANLREVEWDVLVACRTDTFIAPAHMHVLGFGCPRLGWGLKDSSGWTVDVAYSGKQPSSTMTISDDLPDDLRRLVVNELVPWLQNQKFRPYLEMEDSGPFAGSVRLTAQPSDARRFFVLEADGAMAAGAFQRSMEGGWCWALPYVPDRPELWLAAALRDWRERTPDRVPELPGWRTRPQWLSDQERDVQDRLEVLRTEHAEALARYAASESELEALAVSARAAADAGARRLITDQGDSLVHEVTMALRTLGFEVENVDEQLVEAAAPSSPKVEDLRVRDPDDRTWTNITEVRGYKAGAKLSDLQRLGRFAALHLQRTGALPDSRWYIVNHFFGADPDTRAAPLAGNTDDLAVFEEDGGLVIDTRDLFRLLRLVEVGQLTASEARVRLRTHLGVLPAQEETR